MQRNSLIRLSAVIITIILVAILLSQVSITDVIKTILSINPLFIITGFVFYLLTYITRAYRFVLLLNKEVHLSNLIPVICIHNMMNNVLPARTGELSYIYLLKKVHARTTGEGVATLVVARIFDLIVTIILLIASGIFIRDISLFFSDLLWGIYILLFCILAALIALISFGRSFMRAVRAIMHKLHLNRMKTVENILKIGDETVESLENMDMKRNFVSVSAISLLIWFLNIGTMVILFTGMGIALPLQNVIFGATFLNIALFLPINGLAGFGTTEAIWTLVFTPLGMTLNDAIISGFSYHIIVLMYILILGFTGFILIEKRG